MSRRVVKHVCVLSLCVCTRVYVYFRVHSLKLPRVSATVTASLHMLVWIEKGACTPSVGSVYNVYVAEGCIPERDYISEMQDTSNRVSKQVKIYLRR